MCSLLPSAEVGPSGAFPRSPHAPSDQQTSTLRDSSLLRGLLPLSQGAERLLVHQEGHGPAVSEAEAPALPCPAGTVAPSLFHVSH